MEKIVLSDRLARVASMVEIGATVADVGTDHGYMTVWLLQNEIAKYVYATDINKAPLERARARISYCGLADRAETVLCSGVDKLEPNCVDTIIVAGMGGETMISILETSAWAKENVRIILQPQSKQAELRQWLFDNAYDITSEDLIVDGGKTYPIMLVQGGLMPALSLADAYVGKPELHKSPALLKDYITSTINKLSYAITASENSSKPEDKLRREEYVKVISELNEIQRGL